MEKQFNEWTFSGEIVYLKELEGEFAVSLIVRGFSKRPNALSSQIIELKILGEKSLYDEMKARNIELYSEIALSGHMEWWHNNMHGKPVSKIMHIADYIKD